LQREKTDKLELEKENTEYERELAEMRQELAVAQEELSAAKKVWGGGGVRGVDVQGNTYTHTHTHTGSGCGAHREGFGRCRAGGGGGIVAEETGTGAMYVSMPQAVPCGMRIVCVCVYLNPKP